MFFIVLNQSLYMIVDGLFRTQLCMPPNGWQCLAGVEPCVLWISDLHTRLFLQDSLAMDRGARTWVAPLTVSPADPQPAFGFLPHISVLCWWRGLSHQGQGGGELSPRSTTGEAPEEKAGVATWPPGSTLPPPSSESTGKEVTVVFGVTDPDSQEIIRLQSHSGGQRVYFWNAGVPWGPLRTPVGCDKIQWKTAIAQVHAGLLLDQILQKEKGLDHPPRQGTWTNQGVCPGQSMEWPEDELTHTWHRIKRSWRRSRGSWTSCWLRWCQVLLGKQSHQIS